MKTIGIIGAMPSELVDIRASLGKGKIENHASVDYYINTYNDKKIITCCSGIGKVNSALCAQNLINNYNVNCIINAGIAGGMGDDVKVCDIVISKDVMYHDLLARFLDNYPPYNSKFEADNELIALAEEACNKKNIKWFTERIVSGEIFVSDNKTKDKIHKELNPYAVDMESASIGHCAFINKVPFVTIRCISDNSDDNGEISFDQFEKIAAKIVADVTLSMLDKI